MIEAVSLTRRFGDTIAVDRLDFKVAAGEVVGFLGPNGAGKTTTMRMLTGTLPPTAGSASVAGFDVAADSLAARRCIGFMPEHVPLYTDLSVTTLLRYVAELKDVARPTIGDHVHEVAAACGLADVEERLVGHLSKGYRQRVGLAQALIGDPPVLILDEPAAGLDPRLIVEIRELIRGFGGERTILLSSHILGEVEKICDRVMILDRGRLAADTTAAELRDRGGLEAMFLDSTADLATEEAP